MRANIRRWSWLPLILSILGCGCSSSTTPAVSPITPSPTTPNFSPGAYYLAVSQGSQSVQGPGGATFITSLCLGIGSFPTTVQVPVNVEGDRGAFTLRAVSGSLTGEFGVNGAEASGTLRGTARDATGEFSLSVEGAEPASLSGTVTGDGGAGGPVVTGKITLSGPNGSGGCSAATWGLTRR